MSPLRMGFGEHRIQHIHFTKTVWIPRSRISAWCPLGVSPSILAFSRLISLSAAGLKVRILVNCASAWCSSSRIAGTLCPIEDILFGGTGMSVFNQNLFYHVLYLLYRRAGLVQFVSQVSDDLFRSVLQPFPGRCRPKPAQPYRWRPVILLGSKGTCRPSRLTIVSIMLQLPLRMVPKTAFSTKVQEDATAQGSRLKNILTVYYSCGY